MIIIYGYGISLVLLMIVSFLKGMNHFTYGKLQDPSFYKDHDSFLSALGPFSWNIWLQLLMFPVWPGRDDTQSEGQQRLRKKIQWMVAIQWVLLLIALSPAAIMLITTLYEAHQ